MTTSAVSVSAIPPIDRAEAGRLAVTENARMVALIEQLSADDWTRRTECTAWDVRALTCHVLGGFEAFSSAREFAHQMAAARRAAGDGPLVDGMTAVQVRERSSISTADLVHAIRRMGPRQARARGRVPGVLRRLPTKQDVAGQVEYWPLGFLLDVVLTRDTWMHRVDLCRATYRPLVLTADHDGRLVADVVAEWARRHRQPFTLRLTGPAGGSYACGTDGEDIVIDAVEFCRTLSGRAGGRGLLSVQVPF